MYQMSSLSFLMLSFFPPPVELVEPNLSLSFHDGIAAMAFSPDASRLAVSNRQKTIFVWKTTSWELIHEKKGFSTNVNAIAWSPRRNVLIAACTKNDEAKVYHSQLKYLDLEAGKEIKTSILKEGGSNIAITPDGFVLVTVAGFPNTKAHVWDLTTGIIKIAVLDKHHDHVCSAILSPDMQWVATCDGPRVWLWDLTSGKKVWTFGIAHLMGGGEHKVYGMGFCLPENAMIVQQQRMSELIYLDLKTGKERTRKLPGVGRLCAVSQDGTFLATAHPDGGIDLWSTAKLEKLATLTGKDVIGIGKLVISPDGRFLAATNSTLGLRVWAIPKAKP